MKWFFRLRFDIFQIPRILLLTFATFLGVRNLTYSSWFFILLDIDECLQNNGGCAHICTNFQGRYECSCKGLDYRLHADKHECVGKTPFFEVGWFNKGTISPKVLLLTSYHSSIKLSTIACQNKHSLSLRWKHSDAWDVIEYFSKYWITFSLSL